MIYEYLALWYYEMMEFLGRRNYFNCVLRMASQVIPDGNHLSTVAGGTYR